MTTKHEGFNTYQDLELPEDADNHEEKISIEVANNKAELMIETVDKHSDQNFAYATLNRDQLWEHIHNCVNALEGMK